MKVLVLEFFNALTVLFCVLAFLFAIACIVSPRAAFQFVDGANHTTDKTTIVVEAEGL